MSQCKTHKQELKERRVKLLAAGSSRDRSRSREKKKKKKVKVVELNAAINHSIVYVTEGQKEGEI